MINIVRFNYLNSETSLVLLDDLLLEFGSCAGLLLSHVKAALGLSFLLLVTHHLLNACSLKLFLLLLHEH